MESVNPKSFLLDFCSVLTFIIAGSRQTSFGAEGWANVHPLSNTALEGSRQCLLVPFSPDDK